MSGPTGTSRGRDELVGADPRLTKATVDLLARLGPSDRETLTSLLGVGRSTLARAVGALLDARIVVEVGTPPRGRGRPRSLLAVSPSAGSAIGLDFGLRHVRGAIVDGAHNTVATAEVGLAQDYSVAEALGAARSLIGELVVASSGPIVGVGLALPGPVDRGSMALTRSSILPGWANVPILQEFSAEIPYPVVADNESNRLFTVEGVADVVWGSARWCLGRGRGLPRMKVPTRLIWKTSTCTTLPRQRASAALT
ncbi:ROK family protein [Salana multivorans]